MYLLLHRVASAVECTQHRPAGGLRELARRLGADVHHLDEEADGLLGAHHHEAVQSRAQGGHVAVGDERVRVGVVVAHQRCGGDEGVRRAGEERQVVDQAEAAQGGGVGGREVEQAFDHLGGGGGASSQAGLQRLAEVLRVHRGGGQVRDHARGLQGRDAERQATGGVALEDGRHLRVHPVLLDLLGECRNGSVHPADQRVSYF